MTTKETLENANPQIYEKVGNRQDGEFDWDETVYDPFDAREIFDLIRNINDPEHPLSLEELNVVGVFFFLFVCFCFSFTKL